MPDLKRIQVGMRCRDRSCDCQHGRPNDNGFTITHCPVKHAYKKFDRQPNLWLKRGKKGKLIFGCYQECDKDDIRDALEEKGLWYDDDEEDTGHTEEPEEEPEDDETLPREADPDLTVTSLAKAKGLNPQTLRDLGIKNLPDGGVAVPYYDLEGKVIATRHRLQLEKGPDGYDGRFHDPNGRSKLVPYGLFKLRQYGVSGELVIVEGESDQWTCFEAGVHALGIPGINAVKTLQREHLERVKKVFVERERNDGGEDFVKAMKGRLVKLGFSQGAFLLDPPEAYDDINDWYAANPNSFKEELALAMEDAPDLILAAETEDEARPKKKSSSKESSTVNQTEILDTLLQPPLVCFADQLNEAYVATIGDGSAVLRINSKQFELWLRGEIHEREMGNPSDDVVNSLARYFEAEAIFGGVKHNLSVRVAERGDAFYYDLGGKVVEITADGWRVLDHPPILFKRFAGQQMQVMPVKGGSLDEFFSFARFKSKDEKLLVKIRLVDSIIPGYPHPGEALEGDEGSGKSSYQKYCKSLIDPWKPLTRGSVGRLDDFLMYCAHNHMVVLDNVGPIKTWLSDLLCRLISGEGYSKRGLFTDEDDKLFDIQNVLSLNGITLTATRRDLLDRLILIRLDRIPNHERQSEKELNAKFQTLKPSLLGALFDALSAAMRIKPNLRLKERPRMADFAEWGEAISIALGNNPGVFLDSYKRNRALQTATIMEHSPIAQAIVLFMADKNYWEGVPNELLGLLEEAANDIGIKTAANKNWPKDASWLWRKIAETRTTLLELGIEATRDEQARPRTITLRKRGNEAGDSGAPKPPDSQTIEPSNPVSIPSASVSSLEMLTEKNRVSGVLQRLPVSPSSDFEAPSAPSAFFYTLGDEENIGYSSASLEGNIQHPQHLRKMLTVLTEPENPELEATSGDQRILETRIEARQHFANAVGTREMLTENAVSLITTEAEARAAIETLMPYPAIGMDFETTGLDPHTDRVRLIQLSTPEKTYVLDANHVPLDVLKPLITGGPIKVAHNAAFESGFLWHHFKEMPSPIFCTMLGDQVLDTVSRGKGSHDLVKVAGEYANVGMDRDEKKGFQQSDWDGELTPEQIAYAARDSAVLLPTYQGITNKADTLKLGRILDLEMAALPYVAWMEYNGVGFDKDAWMLLADEADGSQRAIQEDMDRVAAEIKGFPIVVNWKSSKQVLDLLSAAGVDLGDFQMDTLKAARTKHKLIPLLLEYKKHGKATSTYGENWLDFIHPTKGRVHANWQQLGTRAGRMSCTDPNLQNLPRDRRYRACFVPTAGNSLIICDYSQIELRVMAEVSGDKAMIEAFNNGLDMHYQTAMAVTGKTRLEDVTPTERNQAKAINFGLIYSMSPKGLVNYARNSFGVDLSEAEAERYHRKFFQTYKGVARWQQNQKEKTSTRTILGRRRTFDRDDDGSRKAYFGELYNSPIQGSAADGLKLAMGELWRTRHQTKAFPVLAVHDELVIECPTADVEAAKTWLSASMAKGMEPILKTVKLGDLTPIVGANWAAK